MDCSLVPESSGGTLLGLARRGPSDLEPREREMGVVYGPYSTSPGGFRMRTRIGEGWGRGRGVGKGYALAQDGGRKLPRLSKQLTKGKGIPPLRADRALRTFSLATVLLLGLVPAPALVLGLRSQPCPSSRTITITLVHLVSSSLRQRGYP